ncbi:hypothetical protein AB6A40_006147 [Gnathostoma spinigerum]|uniref:Secreted protein n=1 Tax=Gnathostoma spinigerum TaxID=75299 RepID=A0ABD6EQZ9_9BILA
MCFNDFCISIQFVAITQIFFEIIFESECSAKQTICDKTVETKRRIEFPILCNYHTSVRGVIQRVMKYPHFRLPRPFRTLKSESVSVPRRIHPNYRDRNGKG